MGDEQIDFVGLYWVGLGVMFLGFLVPLGAMFAIGTLSTYPAFWLAKQVSGEGPEAARLATQLLWLTRILLIFPIGFASSRLLMRRRERFSPTSGQRFKAGCAAPIVAIFVGLQLFGAFRMGERHLLNSTFSVAPSYSSTLSESGPGGDLLVQIFYGAWQWIMMITVGVLVYRRMTSHPLDESRRVELASEAAPEQMIGTPSRITHSHQDRGVNLMIIVVCEIIFVVLALLVLIAFR